MKFESICPLCGNNRRTNAIDDEVFEVSALLQQKLEHAENTIKEQDNVLHEQIKTIYDHIKKYQELD